MDTRHWGRIGIALWAWVGMSCVGEDGSRRDTGQGEDTRVDAEVREDTEAASTDPVIVTFASDFRSVTHGVDLRGREVEGKARLSWETRGATTVELLVDGVPVSLDGCEAGPDGCAASGGLVVAPTERTRFTLRAIGPEGCTGGCPEQSVEIEVKAPVGLRFVPERMIVPPGEDVVVDYEVTGHETFAIGIIDFAGGARLIACAPEGGAVDAAPCVATGEDTVASAGTMRVEDVDRRVTVGVTASNGAEDGLGDIRAGDFFLEIGVPVVIERFEVVPERALPGSQVMLRWRVAGAQTVGVTASVGSVDGLTTCVGVGVDGEGFCTVTLDVNAALVPVRFTLRAEQGSGDAGESQAVLEVIGGPQVAEAAPSLPMVVPGQAFSLEWQAFGADSVGWVAAPGVVVGLEGCVELRADGRGRCEVSVAPGAGVGPVALTLTASNTRVGPPASVSTGVEVVPAPAVTRFEVDDDSVEPGAEIGLEWTVERSVGVTLTERTGVIAAAELAQCEAQTEEGSGACRIRVPVGAPSGALVFELVANGPTGARSAGVERTVAIGLRPEVVFAATPTLLPQGGGEAVLSWAAVGATRVVVVDDEGTVIVESGVTMCGASPCDAEGDEVAVDFARPTSLTLNASNDFGVGSAAVSIGVEGAPVIARLTLGGRDALAGPVLVDGANATLAWKVDNVSGGDQVRLERATSPGPDRGCSNVAVSSWVLVGGFPKTGAEAASGSAMVEGLNEAAQCLRFIAVDVDATPSQRALAVFLAYRAPAVSSFAAADQTVKAGDVVSLSWASARAYRVELTVTPVGAVTSQELAGCNAAAGSCDVTIQPGTPLGEVRFSLVAVGEQGSRSAATALPVTVGLGPSIASFAANPGSAAARVDATLTWTTSLAGRLTIRDGSGEVFASTARATMDAGSHVASGVSASTTWTLRVENEFGSSEAQATTFIGPSIDTLTANGGDARDGVENVVTGPVTIGWSTTSADGAHHLEVANVPGNGSCAGATGWTTVYRRDDAPAASASHALGVVTANRCVRLTVSNSQTPPQSSSAVFLLREMPEVASLVASPSSINGSGTVIVKMGVRGATALGVTAQYRNDAGNVLGTREVCDQGRLNAGSLSGGATVDQVECAHQVTPCNLLCINNGMPSGTTRIRYFVTVSDPEGDGANANTALGGDVTVR